MKFIRRRNGRMMTTLAVKYTLGGVELARLFAVYGDVPSIWDDPPPPGRNMTRGQAEKLVRDQVYSHGVSAYLSEDDFDPENAYTAKERWLIASWAAGEVRRLWPELDDAALREWEDEYRISESDDQSVTHLDS